MCTIKPRRMGGVRNVAHMWIFGKLEGKRPLGKPKHK
jgi:hypothetical protein